MSVRPRDRLRFLAFYLPQFHPIPENDAWWGDGFTEWTNVKKGVPLFSSHYQPHLPDDSVGFYDLREPNIRELQAQLASANGIDGFVYYHYWFGGKRLLERPFNEALASGKPDFPFCLCWANENWTRSWNAHDPRTILVQQQYGENDDRAHIRWLARAFADPRYIRVDGKPLLLVYHASDLPDVRRTTDIWREEAVRLGLDELYLCRVESFDPGDPTPLGFDAGVEFQPDWRRTGPRLQLEPEEMTDVAGPAADPAAVTVFSYPVAAELARTHPPVSYKRYRCVMPAWDNSPRRGLRSTVFVGASPDRYQRWLQDVVEHFHPFSPDENLVFINAWNEWGEGAHLEPDRRWGRAYLEAHLRGTRRGVASRL